jgi:hypothetical protein
MATITESTQQQGGNDKAAGLIAAIGLISGEQTYSFDLYQRVVLPLDGFVFWVKSSLLTPEFLGNFNTTPFNTTNFDGKKKAPPTLTPAETAAVTFSVNASLHVSQSIAQEEDSTYTAQSILFTTKNEVEHFSRIGPTQMYITTIPNGSQIAFGSQANHYQLAGLWHYQGKAVYSTEFTQIVNDPRQIFPSLEIVSNSLPFWLRMSTASVPVYPSYLSPLNAIPPYVTAEIYSTTALGQAPLYTAKQSQSQLVTDRIRFTMYGLNNNAALDFQTMILNTSLDGDYGIMNMPVPVDEKKPQLEFQVIAQKKTMDLQVNYYQLRAREIATRIIERAFMTYRPTPYNLIF